MDLTYISLLIIFCITDYVMNKTLNPWIKMIMKNIYLIYIYFWMSEWMPDCNYSIYQQGLILDLWPHPSPCSLSPSSISLVSVCGPLSHWSRLQRCDVLWCVSLREGGRSNALITKGLQTPLAAGANRVNRAGETRCPYMTDTLTIQCHWWDSNICMKM